jgi:hypothetical protein
MYKRAELSRDEGSSWEDITLAEVSADAELAKLITHDEKPLAYLRQKGVEQQSECGYIVLPPVILTFADDGQGGDSDPKARIS